VSQLCVNTLPTTEVTLITGGIQFGRLRTNIELHKTIKLNDINTRTKAVVVLGVPRTLHGT
jgi:hypothetical protein